MNDAQERAGLALLAAIASAARGGEGVRCLRLMRMEVVAFAALREEVLTLCRESPHSRAGSEAHVTHWTRPRGEVLQYSLLNRSGRFDDFGDDHDRDRAGKRFAHDARYPALAALIAAFPEAVNFRINVLGARARLSPHQEAPLFAVGAHDCGVCARFHLPIRTSPGAELLLDGEVLHLDAGEIYFVNHGCVHAARNLDTEPRVHLVWDMTLCRRATARMFDDGTMPEGLSRCVGGDRAVAALRRERMGAALRLPAASHFGGRAPGFCPPCAD